MPRYLLDTMVISELRKSKQRINQNVLTWSDSIDPLDQFTSVINLHEIEVGILKLERKDDALGSILRTWFDRQLLPSFSQQTLDVNLAIALRASPMHIPTNIDVRDALIAATAIEHGMIVATRNTKHFVNTGAKLINPWV
jgi:predicted nucleic acid-binding protein